MPPAPTRALVPIPAGPGDSGRPDPSWRMLACPPSGAGPMFARPLADAVASAGGSLWGVRYPGRETRRSEAPASSVAALAAEVAGDLRDGGDDTPVVLLGHSLGAGVAAHAATLLADDPGGVRLDALVLSGRRAPTTPERPRGWRGRLRRRPEERDDARLRAVAADDAALTAWLSSLGGTPPALLADEGYLAMILPVLRADLLASLDDDAMPRPAAGRLDVPLLLVCGDADPVVRPDRMRGWSTLAGGQAGELTLPGGHHALVDHPDTVIAAISALRAAR